jgi:hypothetical protein
MVDILAKTLKVLFPGLTLSWHGHRDNPGKPDLALLLESGHGEVMVDLSGRRKRCGTVPKRSSVTVTRSFKKHFSFFPVESIGL